MDAHDVELAVLRTELRLLRTDTLPRLNSTLDKVDSTLAETTTALALVAQELAHSKRQSHDTGEQVALVVARVSELAEAHAEERGEKQGEQRALTRYEKVGLGAGALGSGAGLVELLRVLFSHL